MTAEVTYLLSGIVFGLGSALTPGPLLTLVISQTLRHGVKEGIKVALAPLLTDLPIVLGTIFILSRLTELEPVLGMISFFGSAFLIYLALEIFSVRGLDIHTGSVKSHSIKKGMIANFLNPSPYMFWFTVGAPTSVQAFHRGWTAFLLFLLSFYIFLVGSKVAVAFITGTSRQFLKSRHYIYAMRGIGTLLLLFAALFILKGLNYIGLL